MLIQVDIENTVRNAILFAGDQILPKIIERRDNGNDISFAYRKLRIFLKWIEILERYLDLNFDEEGVIADPEVVCLTEAQAASVLAKLKIVMEGKKYPSSNWILEFGTWNDEGKWVDSEVWNDSITWT